MQIENIISHRFDEDKSYWQIVFEWEDIFAKTLKTTISRDKKERNNFFPRHIPLLADVMTTNRLSLMFEMVPSLGRRNGLNKNNIIPEIIDFYLKPEELERFYRSYSKQKCVLISSKEIYEYLKANKCPLPIYHLGLSISDIYRINENTLFDKPYDLVLMGRPNKVLLEFLEQYRKIHPDFVYIYNKLEDHKYTYFTSKGDSLGPLESRNDFLGLMKKTKTTFYSTPGMDGGELRTNGFNQVTPRFLEQIACGCHIIARYPKNADTDFYEMSTICPCVNTYEEFEAELDKARNTPVDMKLYSDYLSNHYTSVRAKQLQEILSKY